VLLEGSSGNPRRLANALHPRFLVLEVGRHAATGLFGDRVQAEMNRRRCFNRRRQLPLIESH
jgi:hypothetical protein